LKKKKINNGLAPAKGGIAKHYPVHILRENNMKNNKIKLDKNMFCGAGPNRAGLFARAPRSQFTRQNMCGVLNFTIAHFVRK